MRQQATYKGYSACDYSVRALLREDTDEILELLRTSMPDSNVPKTREFWEWKHFRNPFGVSPGIVAVSQGRIVGLRVFLRWIWQEGAHSVLACRAVDTATHPEWRGKGIFSDLTNQLLKIVGSEGITLVFNTPNSFSLPGYLRMGWKQVTRIPIRVRFLRPMTSLLRLVRGTSRRTAESQGFDSVDCLIRESGIAERLKQPTNDSRYRTPRSATYLSWRYSKIPILHYHAKWRVEGEHYAVVIFRERYRNHFLELSINEIFLSPNTRGIALAADLLKEIYRFSKADYVLATAASDSLELAVLNRSGFIPLGKRGPILAARVLGSDDKPLQWTNWRCSLGDLELF